MELSIDMLEPGQWLGNGKHAYKVVRTINCRNVVVLENNYGEFETRLNHLVVGKYRVLSRKPAYAKTEEQTHAD